MEEETGIKKKETELRYITTHRFEGITCKIFIIRTEKEPELKEPKEMSKWIKIKPEELKNYNMSMILYVNLKLT